MSTGKEDVYGKERILEGELRENTSIGYDHGVFTWEGSTVWGPQCLS